MIGEVRALLGQPHGLVAGDHQWSYDVGATNNLFDSDDGHLFMDFDRGHVVYATAPSRDPDGDADDLSTGVPGRRR